MIQTRKLFYEDVYLGEFEANVLECRPIQNGFAVLLDQTAFYPEGGGQPADTGRLGDAEVSDVQEKDGEILHYTDRPLEAGQVVVGRIDWDKRFDLMQQHSGEHIISGMVHAEYGFDNVGFHMGSDVITIDLNGILDMEQLLEIEIRANRYIWTDRNVEISYPSDEELRELPYRSKKELTDQVRIVTFPGADICACCGLHVAKTGEIGMVKILSAARFRDGVRVEMISGERVLSYLRAVSTQNRQVSAALSVPPYETAGAVTRMQEENYSLRGRLHQMEKQIFAMEAARHEGEGSVLLFQDEMEPDSVRALCDAVMKTCRGCCAVFSRNPDGSYKYAIGEQDGDLRTFVKEMNAALSGRGGGKPFFVQGSVRASEEKIRRFFSR